jgi:regulator of sigma E protease
LTFRPFDQLPSRAKERYLDGKLNLLPFPALDGGRIIFVLPELVLRRRVPPEFENLVHAVGFLLGTFTLVLGILWDVVH